MKDNKTRAKTDRKAGANKGNAKPSIFARLKKVIREVISELKKVEWAQFKNVKNNKGVFSQTGVVLVVVVFFLIIMVAFDSGLLALMRLLTNG